MATPASAVSDVGEPQAEEPPQAEAVVAAEPEGPEAGAAAMAESAGASNQSALAAAASGDASSAPAPAPDSAAAPPPASPAARAATGPPRPQFAGSPAYMAPPSLSPSPSPAFSYNVLPRAPPASQVGAGAASLQPGSSPVGILSYSLLQLICLDIAMLLYACVGGFLFPRCVSVYGHMFNVVILTRMR
jgi:transcription elongation regulator 1